MCFLEILISLLLDNIHIFSKICLSLGWWSYSKLEAIYYTKLSYFSKTVVTVNTINAHYVKIITIVLTDKNKTHFINHVLQKK